MAKWTFVTNHAVILSYVAKNPSITARELALEAGITERAVRGILADLQSEGYIIKRREGRGVRYGIKARLPLRHPAQQDKQVGALLGVLGWKGKSARGKTPRKP